jgi:hypothetical protein
MQVVLAHYPETPILYFSQTGWDAATEGLTNGEIGEAVQDRRRRWSPKALGHALEWIAQRERTLLTLIAKAMQTASGANRTILAAHFGSTLTLLSEIAGKGRFDDMEWMDLLEIEQQKDVLIMHELPEGNERTLRRSFADAYAAEFAARGNPDLAAALPHTDPQRGAWIAPFDDDVRQWINLRGIPRLTWKDGVVLTVPLSAIEQFRERGKQITILYVDPGGLMQDMSELTRAQLRRKFERLSKADDMLRERQKDDYWNALRLAAAQLRRTMLGPSSGEPRLKNMLAGQVETETGLLAESLARSQTWLTEDVTPSLAELKRMEYEVAQDVRFLIGLSRARGDKNIESRLTAIQERKRSDIARIDGIQD